MDNKLTSILSEQKQQLYQMSKTLVANFLEQYDKTILKQLEFAIYLSKSNDTTPKNCISISWRITFMRIMLTLTFTSKTLMILPVPQRMISSRMSLANGWHKSLQARYGLVIARRWVCCSI